MRNMLLESLSSKVGSNIPTRRYSLSEIISESYKSLYECNPGTNLYKLTESYINDVRNNPTDIERLSRQLCILKEMVKMTACGDLKDEDLVPKEKYDTVEPKEERSQDVKESKEGDLDESCDDHADDDLLEDTELTDEEVEELEKHLEEIRKNKKSVTEDKKTTGCIGAKVGDIIVDTKTGKEGEVKREGQSGNYSLIYVDFGKGLRKINPMDDAQTTGRYQLKECDSPKKSVEESTKPRKLKRSISEAKDPSPEIQDRIMTVLADTIYGFGVEPNDLGELLDDLVYNIAMLMPSTDESRKLKRANEAAPVWSRYHIVNPDGETIDSYTDRKDAEDWVNQLYKDGDYKRGDLKVVDSQAKNESKSYESLNLSDFGKKSSSKAFVKTFKKLQDKLKEGTALTRQESISLYKAANSAMTHLSVELEHNPEFLDTFKESVELLSADVNKILGSLKEGKAPSKKTMKSLAKFTEALLEGNREELRDRLQQKVNSEISRYGNTSSDTRLSIEDCGFKLDGDKVVEDPESQEKARRATSGINEADEETPIEDEESEFISDGEGDVSSEEEEEFDQEYAEARVELHKELAAEHADSEDPGVQEKIEKDAEEVVNLDGITDDQVAEIEEEDPEDSDITDDELEELKKHLKEMRRTSKLAKVGDIISVNRDEEYYKDHGYKMNDEGYVVKKVENYGVFIDGYKYLIPHSDYKIMTKK